MPSASLAAALSGFALSFSLILAIGAQNAFVLRQGLRREHVLPIVLFCAASDAALIALGVAGFGWVVLAAPWIVPALTWGGAAFLFVYGALAVRRALGPPEATAPGAASPSLPASLATCFLLTWANPHVWLDTVVLLGSVSSDWGPVRWRFGAGAMTGSVLFFFALGYGARLLAPLFARPAAWRVLDLLVGGVMWWLALMLVTT